MDVAVLLLFALFFSAVVVTTTSRYDVLRGSIRRPRVFQLAAVGAAAVTVSVDLYALVYDAVGPGSASLRDVAGRLLLLNVAAACGLASLHAALRVPSDDGHGMRMGVLGWTGPLIALVVVTAVVALGSSGSGSSGNGTGPDSIGSTAGSTGAALAIYSLLVCVISASSLFRRGVRSILRRDEDRRGFCTVDGGRWLREGLHRHNPVHGAEQISTPDC